MKTIVKIMLFALLFVLLLGIKGVKAMDEYTRVIRREFAVNTDAQLTINNKFGKVHCANWDKQAVAFEITITVTASSQENANRMLDRITVDFTDSPSAVTAITNMKEMKSPGNKYFAIDYMVNMPASLNLDVTNKFGDIFINELLGKGKIYLGYGSLDVNKLGNSDNLLDIRFSKANVNWIKGAVVILKYSDLELDYAGSMRLDSKFSNLDADKIIAFNVVFEGGKLDMENSAIFDSRSKFSDLEIQRIDKSVNLDIQYGSCDIHEIPADFTSINITNKYGDVSVGISETASYSLDADLKFCDLDYPGDKAKFTYRSNTPTEKSYRGIIGGGENPAGKVIIKSEFGNVSL